MKVCLKQPRRAPHDLLDRVWAARSFAARSVRSSAAADRDADRRRERRATEATGRPRLTERTEVTGSHLGTERTEATGSHRETEQRRTNRVSRHSTQNLNSTLSDRWRSGRKRAALRTARRRGKPHVREVCTAPAVRDLAWARPYHAGSPARQPRWGARAVSRLSSATRRSPRSLPQHISGLNVDGDPTKSN